MLHLKQILHNIYIKISSIILQTKTDLTSLGVVPPKLSVSGEPWETAILPDVASEYSNVNGSDLYLKFVVATNEDFDEVTRAVEEYRKAGVNCPVYLMPLGGRSEEYSLNVKDVAEACMERGWRFTPRLHISLFGNAWGT